MFCNACDKDVSTCFICGKELSYQIICVYMNQVSSEFNPMSKGFHLCSTTCYDVFNNRLNLMIEPIITTAVSLETKSI